MEHWALPLVKMHCSAKWSIQKFINRKIECLPIMWPKAEYQKEHTIRNLWTLWCDGELSSKPLYPFRPPCFSSV